MGNFQVILTSLLLHSLIVAAASFKPSFTEVARAPGGSRTVDLPLGTVQGVECPLFPEITRYLGIPFSEPRLGLNRWTRPVAYNRPYPEPALQATTEPPPCGSTCYYNVEDSSTASEVREERGMWISLQAHKLRMPSAAACGTQSLSCTRPSSWRIRVVPRFHE